MPYLGVPRRGTATRWYVLIARAMMRGDAYRARALLAHNYASSLAKANTISTSAKDRQAQAQAQAQARSHYAVMLHRVKRVLMLLGRLCQQIKPMQRTD